MTQRDEILKTMHSDPGWSWSYAELSDALPHIARPTLRVQVARLVASGAVTRHDTGLFRVTHNKARNSEGVTLEDATQTDSAGRNSTDDGRAFSPENAPEALEDADTDAPVTPVMHPLAPTHPRPHSDGRTPTDAPAHNARERADGRTDADTRADGRTDAGADGRTPTDADTGADANTSAPTSSRDRDRVGSSPHPPTSLHEHPTYSRVLEALPIAPMQAALRIGTALGFVRSQLEDCEAPALGLCGRSGTGKSISAKALCILLHGNTDDVTRGDNLTTKPGVIGRREKTKNGFVAVPSVLLEPPERPRPAVVVIDEAANAEEPARKGIRSMIHLEAFYMLEGTAMPIRAALIMTWNKPPGVKGYYHPFGSWEGSTRRLLICDMDAAPEDVLSEQIVTRAARRVFAALEDVQRIELSDYKPLVRYPSTALLEKADEVKAELFVRPSDHPVGDPVLKGLTVAFSCLFGYSLERALFAALADIAVIVSTTPELLRDDAEDKLNARLRALGLEPVALQRPEPVPIEDDSDAMTLSPAARKRVAAHLAKASTQGVDELLTTLCEYNLASRRWRPVRAPRWLLEVAVRWVLVLCFGIFAAVWNVALSRLLKMPRVSGGAIYAVFGFAARGPATRLTEYVDKHERPLTAPRDYVLRLFQHDLTPRETIDLETGRERIAEGPVTYAEAA